MSKTGRPMNADAQLEELRVEAQSVGYELMRFDAFELSVIDSFRASFAQARDQLAHGDAAGADRTLTGCQALLVRWHERDGFENAKHREIARGWRAAHAS